MRREAKVSGPVMTRGEGPFLIVREKGEKGRERHTVRPQKKGSMFHTGHSLGDEKKPLLHQRSTLTNRRGTGQHAYGCDDWDNIPLAYGRRMGNEPFYFRMLEAERGERALEKSLYGENVHIVVTCKRGVCKIRIHFNPHRARKG